MNRSDNIRIANETLKILNERKYNPKSDGTRILNSVDLSQDIDHAVSNTVYYPHDYVFDTPVSDGSVIGTVEVTGETTASAGRRLSRTGNVAVLNFASAKHPGGGWLSGAQAQEEDLTRCSALYPCLLSRPKYYEDNVQHGHYFYTDGIIYSPEVPFFRSDDTKELLAEPFGLSVITCPAPNLSVNLGSRDGVEAVLEQRIRKILNVASHHGHETLVLGAFGCGVFGNDPAMVASIFKKELSKYSFRRVCFAIYDTRPGQPAFKEFENTFVAV